MRDSTMAAKAANSSAALQLLGGGSDFGFDPRLGFALPGGDLQGVQGTAHLPDFIGAGEVLEGVVQLTLAPPPRIRLRNDATTLTTSTCTMKMAIPKDASRPRHDRSPCHSNCAVRPVGEFGRSLIDLLFKVCFEVGEGLPGFLPFRVDYVAHDPHGLGVILGLGGGADGARVGNHLVRTSR